MLVTSVAWLIFCMYHTKSGKLLQHSVKLQPPLLIHLHGNFRVQSWAAVWKCRVALSCSPTLSLGPSSSKITIRTSPYMSRYTTNIRVTWGEEEEMSHVLTITVEKMDPNMKLQYTVNPSYEVTGKIQQYCSQRGKVSYKERLEKYIIL